MRPLVVVVQEIFVDDRLQVALVDDKHPVEAVAAAAPDPALGMRIGPRRHQWSQDYSSTLAIGRPDRPGCKLLVPIVDQHAEIDPLILESPTEIASLLGKPGGIRFRGAA